MPVTNAQLRAEPFEIWQPPERPAIATTDRAYTDHILRQDFRQAGVAGVSIGQIPDPENFSRHSLIEDMFAVEGFMIKEAGGDYKIPKRISPFCRGFIESVAADQHARSPLADTKHAVFYFRRSFVPYGRGQGALHWHCDDNDVAKAIKGLASHPIRPTNSMAMQAYMASNMAGTRIQNVPVRDADTVFTNTPMTGDVERQKAASRVSDPYEIMMISDYTRHSVTALQRDWVDAAAKTDPLLANLADPQGCVRAWACVMYIPTELTLERLGKCQRIQEPSSLNFDQ